MNKETDLTYLSSLNQKYGKTQTMIIELQQENKQLQERIDKAIEYMEKSMHNPLKYEWGVLKHTLAILKGGE